MAILAPDHKLTHLGFDGGPQHLLSSLAYDLVQRTLVLAQACDGQPLPIDVIPWIPKAFWRDPAHGVSSVALVGPLSPEATAMPYLESAQATWEAAKAADPDCVFVTCSGSSGPKRRADVRDFLRLGGCRFTDAIGIHPCPELGAPVWRDLQGTIRRLRNWSREEGFEHPV